MGSELHGNRSNSPETLDEFLVEDTFNKARKIKNKWQSSALPVNCWKCDNGMLKIRWAKALWVRLPPPAPGFAAHALRLAQPAAT